MFNNSKDIPFAIGYVFSLYYLLQAHKKLPTPPNSLIMKLAIAIGLTLGIRVGGVMLYAVLLFSFLLSIFFAEGISIRSSFKKHWRPLGILFLKIMIASYLIMIFFWPWTHRAPFTRPMLALTEFSNFPYFASAPFYYIPKFVLIKFPELIILLLFAGSVYLIYCLAAKHVNLRTDVSAYVMILVFSILFPIFYIIIMRSSLYDEIRQLIFIQLPLIILAGILMDKTIKFLSRKKSYAFLSFCLILSAYLAYHGTVLVRLFPYQYIYYNVFIGGLSGAAKLGNPIDYWAHSYREITVDLVNLLRCELKNDFDRTIFKIYVIGPYWSASYYFPKNFVLVSSPIDADFIITFTRNDIYRTMPGKIMLTVKRSNVLLSLIKDNRSQRS